MTSEKLTRALIESHLMSFIEIRSEEQRDNVVRYAWALSSMADEARNRNVEDREWSFEFSSHDAARNFAFGWIRRNRPQLIAAAKKEAKDGIAYRASKTR